MLMFWRATELGFLRTLAQQKFVVLKCIFIVTFHVTQVSRVSKF